MKRNVLVTSALPYANGPIHLGHLIEYIQSDIWCRYHKLSDTNCWYVCADDAHGTPVMISAQKSNISPEEMIDRTKKDHIRDLSAFGIEFDHYSSTHTATNKYHVYRIYNSLKAKGLIDKKSVDQLFDKEKNVFLPDRFIKGECPKCTALDQYGDGCEVCGSVYSPTELKSPYSVLSKSVPVMRASDHYFFRLSDSRCVSFLKEWIPTAVQDETVRKLKEWIGDSSSGEANLADWDISRDKPYFGFSIPDEPDKFFYVWFDAPIAYIATSHELCNANKLSWKDIWEPDSEYEIYHFIGKDIVYFHTLFWPSLLKFSDTKLPTKVFIHGFLTINHEKMSKSRGNFVSANDYLSANLDPEWMRYYVAAHSGRAIKDIDLNWTEFHSLINSNLIGKYINVFSRSVKFADILGGNLLAYAKLEQDAKELEIKLLEIRSNILKLYELREFSKVTREVMGAADKINKYIDEKKPWLLAKNRSKENDYKLLSCVSAAIRGFVILTLYMKPIIPRTAQRVEEMLDCGCCIDASTLPRLEHVSIAVSQDRTQLMNRVGPEHEGMFTFDQKDKK